jgi:hypothetical protein
VSLLDALPAQPLAGAGWTVPDAALEQIDGMILDGADKRGRRTACTIYPADPGLGSRVAEAELAKRRAPLTSWRASAFGICRSEPGAAL